MSAKSGKSRGKSRREFLQAAAAGAAGTVLAPGLGPALAQQKVTRLRVGLTPPATQTTVGFQTENAGTGPLQPMYEFLTSSDRFTGEIKPGLATSWESSPDGKSWKFKLRPGIAFHDGSPFTARDVTFSWERLTAKDSRATTAGLFRKLIPDAKNIVEGDGEVTFNLTAGEPELPYYLTQGFIIYSKTYWDKVGQEGYIRQPVGTGPFRFKEFREGQYLLYARVEKHWRQTPEFPELQLLYMPEDTTRLAALLTGEVHIAEIPRSVQNQAIARGKQIVASTRSAAIISGRFGGNYLKKGDKPGPLTNPLVRQAMNLAVNREEIRQQIFNGRGEIAAVEGFQKSDPEFDPGWTPYPYDPAKAKQLLQQAGVPSGYEFEMTVVSPPGFPEVPTVVEALAIYFNNVGLKPKLIQMEVAEQNNRQRSANFYNFFYTNRQSIKPLFQAMDYFWSKGIYHFFEDPFIEERMAVFSTSTDQAKRSAIIREIGGFLYKQHATLPLLYMNAEVGVDPTVVAEYKADIGAYGASVGHEYTKMA
jgi:peptide/nickel transport system substrate-binding protein